MTAPSGGGRRYPAAQLAAFVARVLEHIGLREEDAALAARLMVAADQRGADAHGVFRLPQYVTRIQSGGMKPRPDIRVVQDHPATALVDGDNGMGHLVMTRAAAIAMEKAESSGIGWVGVRRSNHAGPAALYAMMPLERDMIGLYLAVGNANHMAPWGGVELLLSTNPIAVAIPAKGRPPVVLDMATTNVAYGKVKRAAQMGEQMPAGWMIDRQGQAITDPLLAHLGSLEPVGGFKGYGLALMFGLLAGTLNGAAMGRDVVDFNADTTTPTNTGHVIAAIDVRRFQEVERFKSEVDRICAELTGSARRSPDQVIRIPGDESARRAAETERLGVPLSAPVIEQLQALASRLGLPGL